MLSLPIDREEFASLPPEFRRQPSQLLGSDRRRRHPNGVAKIVPRAKTSFSHQGVNGYLICH